MSRKHRKIYKQGKEDGYALGYTQGLHDGNPFIKIGEVFQAFCENISRMEPAELRKIIDETRQETDSEDTKDGYL